LAISDWHECLRLLLEARRQRGAWPAIWDEPIERLMQATLRFSRPDGSPATVFDGPGPEPAGVTRLRDWANASKGTGVARVLGPWLRGEKNGDLAEELPAWTGSERVLAALRADGMATGDFLVVDHRDAEASCRFDLFGGGRSWLGPSWTIDGEAPTTSPPKPRSWISSQAAGLAEWSYRAGDTRITQSALLLRGRRLALLTVLFEDRAALPRDLQVRVSLPATIAAAPDQDRRAYRLTEPRKPGSALVLPIGLPCLAYPTDRGRFEVQESALVLKHVPAGRRCWLPLLVSWDPVRNRRRLHWRVLTVSERSRIVPPDRAFAARVSWGPNETYVIYRSLAPPAPRAFLGCQTPARFLVGLFTKEGVVEPILTVE